MLAMTFSFMVVELTVGYVANSLALVADSFHMLSDVVALIVGLISVRVSHLSLRKSTKLSVLFHIPQIKISLL